MKNLSTERLTGLVEYRRSFVCYADEGSPILFAHSTDLKLEIL